MFKKITFFALLIFIGAGRGFASDGSDSLGRNLLISVSASYYAVACVVDVIRGSQVEPQTCAMLTAYSSPVYSVTTTVLLKEVESAGPDALAYAAGADPSPLLYSVAEKLQGMTFESTGEEPTFDEVVDAILAY